MNSRNLKVPMPNSRLNLTNRIPTLPKRDHHTSTLCCLIIYEVSHFYTKSGDEFVFELQPILSVMVCRFHVDRCPANAVLAVLVLANLLPNGHLLLHAAVVAVTWTYLKARKNYVVNKQKPTAINRVLVLLVLNTIDRLDVKRKWKWKKPIRPAQYILASRY